MGKTGAGRSARKNSKTMAVDNMPITQKKRLYLRKKFHIAAAYKGIQTATILLKEHIQFRELK